MRHVDDLWTGDARYKVLVPPGEAHYFVGEDRPADQELIVLQDQPVEPHRYVQREPALAERLHLGGRQDTQCDEGPRQVPAVVEDAGVWECGGVGVWAGWIGPPVAHLHADQLAQRRVVHRLVGTQRDQVIQRGHLISQQLVEQAEEERHWRSASVVGDDDQHALARQASP